MAQFVEQDVQAGEQWHADRGAAAYAAARARYAELEVDTEAALAAAAAYPLSLHCWQGDDVGGFEVREQPVGGGGILATGNYPGRARNGDELRQDLDQVLKLLPGRHKINLHACYAETGGRAVPRDELAPAHFTRWLDWARARQIGLDFNSTNFAHPLAADGFTLSHPDDGIRGFWIRHAQACRQIAAWLGQQLKTPCIMNHWIPDGAKDLPADRWAPRARLRAALDEIFDAALDPAQAPWCDDAVESKLFGIGSEAYVVGSFEFYCGYALTRGLRLCLDMGHFHPTETIHDKCSALLQFLDKLLVHVSRPMRWDSDHVVLFNDDTQAVFQELARGGALDRVALALDYFDASINRIGAYVIGARAARKALLAALLEPGPRLRALEAAGRLTERLAWMEEIKTLPFGAVWEELCVRADVPPGAAWLPAMRRYEAGVLAARA